MDQGTQFHNSSNGSDNRKTIVYIETLKIDLIGFKQLSRNI